MAVPKLRRTLALTLALVMLVLAAGCSKEPAKTTEPAAPAAPKADTSDIIIGSALPLTGSEAKMGTDMNNSIQMAIDEINAKGGVLGRKLKLEKQDDPCDAAPAVAAANKLVSLNVVAAVSGYCSGSFLPTEKVYNDAKIGVIVPAANAVSLTQQKFNNINLMNPTNQDQAKSAAAYFVDNWKAKKVAILHDNSAFAKELAELTRDNLKGKAEVVAFEAVTKGEKDFSATLTALKGKAPDAIYWTGYYAEGGLIIKQARSLGITAKIMVGDGSNDPTLITTAGAAAAEGVANSTTPSAKDFPNTKDWIPKYQAKYGEPGPYSAQAYDAVYIIAEAIKKAGAADREKVMNEIRKIQYQGLTGKVSFNENGNRNDSYFLIQEVKGGKFEVVKK
ncbi:MAG TPA: branched-chain amino acid ABC transporter substrate-binding protein [Symbiobacteriaceae bacterium]|nr:branched-chain amino acid ABC transporter substrate-binding protein [Symbiobacteriaceae bacterium]